MATLEEIAEQFEEALGESTGTTIEPGTITPQGIVSSASGKKKLSWPEIVERINEGVGVRQNELLPEVPKGVSAQKFYRTAAQAGLLPSGVNTFTSAPFGSFQGRMNTITGETTPSEESSLSAPESPIETQYRRRQEDSIDDGKISDDPAREWTDPMVNPDFTLATLPALLASPTTTLMGLHNSPNTYDSLVGYSKDQIDDMVAVGRISSQQVAQLSRGIFHTTADGRPIDPKTGKPTTVAEYYKAERDRAKNNPFLKLINMITGGDKPEEPGTNMFGQPALTRDEVNKIQLGYQALTEKDYPDTDTGGIDSGPLGTETMDASGPDVGDTDDADFDMGYDSGDFGIGGDDYGGEDGDYGFQEGGQVPQGAEADMSNLGMINEQAAQPQQGGAKSVKDDIPREADEGDYILPYETVLLVGLKDLNRYAREAIDLAMKNGVNLKGTDLDPSDDVPIKVSNYEYHIPKMLVPFFGGGKKYLDKIRQEGLDLRKRLEEEKKPSMQEQQPMAEAQPAPAPAQAAPAPQAPMMQQGGFVDDPQKKQMQTSAAVLEADASQQSPSAYNQMQALERTRRQAQQPPMVDPMGRVVQQGFAAPQGYADGDEVKQETMPAWASRALDPKTPVLRDEATGDIKTVRTMSINYKGQEILFPTIRLKGKELVQLSEDEALAEALKKGDYISFNTPAEATEWSKNFSKTVNDLRGVQQGFANGTEPGGMKLVKPFEMEQSVMDAVKPPEVDESGFASKSVPAPIEEPEDETVIETSEVTFDPNMFKVNQTKKPSPGKGPLTDEEFISLKEDVAKLQQYSTLELLALTGMAEARGDKRDGIRGAMNVINNRLKYPKRFGKTLREIIFKRYQFEAIPNITSKDKVSRAIYDNFKNIINIKQGDKTFLQALRDGRDILLNKAEDNTFGAVYFANLSKLKTIPKHLKGRKPTVTIGSTSFFGIEPTEKNDGGFVDRAA